MITKSFAFAKTELFTIWRDKKALILIISFPIFFALLYGLVLGAFNAGSENNFLAAIPSTLATMTAFTCINGSAGSVARSRENKIFARVLMENVKKSNLILGKIFYFMLVTCLQTILLLITGCIFFGLNILNVFNILFITLLFSFFALALGIILANLTDSEDGAEHSTVFVSFAMLVLGAWFPINTMPEIAQKIAHLNPVYYFIKIINNIIGVSDRQNIIVSILIITALCIITFIFSCITFKKGDI